MVGFKKQGCSKDVDSQNRESFNTVFGDKIIAKRITMLSAQFQYPLASNQAETVVENGGAVGYDESRLKLNTSTAINGTSAIESKETVRYVPGHEVFALFTVAFDTPVADSYQRAGLYDANNGFYLSYEGTQFYFNRKRNGVIEEQIPVDTSDFNPQNMNVYRLTYGYLGVAPIQISVLMPDGSYKSIGYMGYTGTSKLTHTIQTFLPARAEIGNTGNSTDLSMYIGSIDAGIIDGGSIDTTGREFSAETLTTSVGTNTMIGSFRNATTFGGKENRVKSRLLYVSVASEGAQPVSVELRKNMTESVAGTWASVNADSIIEQSTDVQYTVGTGEPVFPVQLAKSDSKSQFLTEIEVTLLPGETATFVGNSGATSEVKLSVRYRDLF